MSDERTHDGEHEHGHGHGDPFSDQYLVDDGDPSSRSTLYVGVVGGVLLVVIILWVTTVFNNVLEEERFRKQVEPLPADRERILAQQETELNSYGWVDDSLGVAHVPIDRAMEMVVAERARNN